MNLPPNDEQERNLRRLSIGTLVMLFVATAFITWWLYQGAGFFHDEMSYGSAYGPRKGPRVPLPAGTVPRDRMGFDNADLGEPALVVTPSAAIGAKLYRDECVFCHAAGGRGDTPVGLEYDPRPPDLNLVVAQRSDAELFQAISDGMVTPEIDTFPPVGARWHAFRLYLDEADRRQLVAYLRLEFGRGHRPAPPPATTISRAPTMKAGGRR